MILQAVPDLHAQIDRAHLLIDKGQKEEAQQIFDQLRECEISGVDILAKFGELALHLGEQVHAINVLSGVVESAPDNAGYLDLYAQALMAVRSYKKAEELLRKAIELDPNFQPAYVRLAAILLQYQDVQQAIPLLEKAVRLKPGDTHACVFMVGALRYANRHEESLEYAKKLVRMAPKDPANLEGLARVYIELGDFEEARRFLDKALRVNPAYGPAFNSLTAIHNFTSADDPIIRQAEAALRQPMVPAERALIHFSLGRMYSGCKQWDKAFSNYRQANLLKKPGAELSIEPVIRRFRKSRKTYSRKFFEKAKALSSDSEAPVFVVGMPRSGTTLIEQIIASHSLAAGAGELLDIDRIEKSICPDELLSDYGRRIDSALDGDVFLRHAGDYIAVLERNYPGASRIVDKMPMNFWYLGLINLLFPRARIIHAVRSPLDTCLSCYFQPFESIPWSHDLGWIGSYYRAYREAMDHWKRVLPANRVTEIRYEDLIGNPEGEIRSLIEACGLPWEEGCLAFHAAKRAIATASVWQARQPIYRTAQRRWTRYLPYLGDLAGELEGFLDEEDMAEFNRHGVKLKKRWRVGFGR